MRGHRGSNWSVGVFLRLGAGKVTCDSGSTCGINAVFVTTNRTDTFLSAMDAEKCRAVGTNCAKKRSSVVESWFGMDDVVAFGIEAL